MTGFARTEGSSGDTIWSWEIRAVNGKGLDIRLRLPSGLDALEAAAKKICSANVSRGNLQVALSLKTANAQPVPTVNETILTAVHSALCLVHEKTGAPMPDAAQILAVRGVLELSDSATREPAPELQNQLLEGLEEALQALNTHRAAEGSELASFLTGHIQQIEDLAQKADADPSRTQTAIETRIHASIARLGKAGDGIDVDRVAAEVALLATKADIQEELDRLSAHIVSARDLIEKGSPVGRKLEFLAQEFNREANTLCSKSNAISITETGLALKVVVDQFREQVLNVE